MKLERILAYGMFSDGSSIGDWSIEGLYHKLNKSAKPFTFAEKHAISFLEEMGRYFASN